MVIWVVAVCCDLPITFIKIAGVAALIALIGEVLVAVDVFDATIDSGFNTTNATIISIVACVLWAIVVLMSCRG